jgi:hypothetical protein
MKTNKEIKMMEGINKLMNKDRSNQQIKRFKSKKNPSKRKSNETIKKRKL